MSAADIVHGRQGGRRVPKGVDPTSLAEDVARIVREHTTSTVTTGCDSDGEQLNLFGA